MQLKIRLKICRNTPTNYLKVKTFSLFSAAKYFHIVALSTLKLDGL